MNYQCRECSYRGTKVDARGGCPACGSLDIHISLGTKVPEAKPRSRRMQLTVMLILWATFAVLVLWKLWS